MNAATNRRSELEASRTAENMADAYDADSGDSTARRRLVAQIATRYRDLAMLHRRLADLLPSQPVKKK